MRLYGRRRVIRRDSSGYADRLMEHYDNETPLGARQMIHLDFDLIQTSCGARSGLGSQSWCVRF